MMRHWGDQASVTRNKEGVVKEKRAGDLLSGV